MNFTIRQAAPANRPAHPELVPIIGQKLSGLWLIGGPALFMTFDNGMVIQASPTTPGFAGFERGLELKIGQTKPGTDWHAELADLGEPPEAFRKLIGQPFRGLDIDVFEFGAELGLLLHGRGVRLVRAREAR